ncbi:MAG: Nif3-like dinuclear metal center hexameric protein [Oscillospiraceae bacterium]
MATVKDIYEALDKFAPCVIKMDFDNVGLLVGSADTEVSRVLLALDITDAVIGEAIEEGAQLIVSHHPMFFSLKSVNDMDPAGRKIVRLLSHGISAVCMHTNLDAAAGGVNDELAKAVGIAETKLISTEGFTPNDEPYCAGRWGELPTSMPMSEFLPFLKERLETNGLRYSDSGKPVKKVAVIGGSGGSELGKVLELGCDTFITADVKYDVFLSAAEAGINIIDGDHFCTENVVLQKLLELIANEFKGICVTISKKHCQTARFF